MHLNWLIRLYAWAIGFLIALVLALHVIAALAAYLAWLVFIVILLIILRLVWWYTNY